MTLDCDGAPRRSFTYGELWDESDAYVVGWGVQQATCSGYFKKENAKTFGFTKRWYKLQGNVLLYYENEHKSKAKGVIDVSAAAICIAAVYCAVAKFSSSTHAAFSGCGPCVRPRGESRQSAMGKGPPAAAFFGWCRGGS